MPRIVLTPDWRLDVDQSPATEADIADPIKERLYARLPGAVEKLARYHNRYPAELEPAEILKDLLAAPFAEADMLDIHLQIGALTDLREADARKPEPERLDPDCMAALDGVLRLGPPVTMGHPDVDLFEARSTEYARSRHLATEAEGERRVARGLSEDERLATERTRKTAAQLASSDDTGRVASYRSDFHRNAVIALGYVAIEVGNAATGHVTGQVVTAAAQFVVAHKDAIMATAPAWGQTGYKWAEYLIMRSDLILKEALRDAETARTPGHPR